ncbi:MAG: GH25 family lysozyme [Pyrinomonadaceae bacterium]
MVAIANMPRGIDVSKFQGNVNWQRVKNSGISFAFARAIDDATGTTPDPKFARNWQGMKDAGIFRGAYYFLRPNRNMQRAADLFVSTVGQLGAGDLPPVLDVESADGASASNILDDIQEWMSIVEGALNREIMIYTFRPFWENTLGNSTRFSNRALWTAHFTSAPQPRFPSAFPRFSFWQFTDTGTCPGVTGNVDLDRFNGSMNGLRAFAGLPPES